jgi:DNA-binding transcriptional MerR regulator
MGPVEELRVEELARRTDTSVDTIRFYQKRDLLPPPRREGRVAWYSPEHLEQLQRIRDLQARGFSLAVIRRLLAGELDAADEPLAAAVVDAAEGELLTLDELASRAGVPTALLDAILREGLLVPRSRDGELRFAASDVALVSAGLRLLEVGLPLPELLALARRHHAATRAIAEDAVTLFDEHVREPLRTTELGAEARAQRLVEAFRTLLPTVTALVEHHFRAVLLEVAQEHLEAVGEQAELDAARAEPTWGGLTTDAAP